MPASYPTSAKSFSTKVDNIDLVQSSHINDIQNEVAAIETQLIAGGVNIATPTPTANAVPKADAAGKLAVGWLPDNYPSGFLFGLTLANGTDATNDINIAVGKCRNVTDAYNIILASALAGKQLDATWAVGAAAGMRASGAAIADTTYHIFLIKRPDTGVVDVAADTSVTGANITANTNTNYTIMRRVGSIVRAAGTIRGFIQDGNTFTYRVPVVNLNAANPPDTNAHTFSVNVPLGIRVNAILAASVYGDTATDNVGFWYLSDLSVSDVATSAAAFTLSIYSATTVALQIGSITNVFTDTSAQIRYRVQVRTAGSQIFVNTQGWIDTRGTV